MTKLSLFLLNDALGIQKMIFFNQLKIQKLSISM